MDGRHGLNDRMRLLTRRFATKRAAPFIALPYLALRPAASSPPLPRRRRDSAINGFGRKQRQERAGA